MKKTFTLFKILRPLLLALCCIFGAEQAMAQYTASLVEKGAWYTALSKDNSGNLYVVRYNGSTYQLVKWAGGNPASSTVLVNGLASSGTDYPWGIAVNPANGDVFVTNPDGGSNWQIIRVPGGTGTPTVVQSGNYYSAICLDVNNELLALEWNSGANTYRVRRYSANGSTLLGTVYDGLAIASDGSYPFAMDVDSHGNIYITNFYNNSDNSGEPALVKLTAPGYAATPVQTGGRHFSGLHFDANNNLYTIEQASPGSATYRVMKYTDPAGAGTLIYSPLATDVGFYPWGITEINGFIYVNDGAAKTDINGVSATGQLLRLTPPAVSVVSVNRVSATPTNAASVQYTVTFSGTAANVTNNAFSLTTTGGISGASVASVTGSDATYTVTVNTGTGDGTIRLDVTGTFMGNWGGGTYTSGQVYTIDKTLPTGSVSINAGAAYANAAAVTLTLTGSDANTLQMAFSQNNVTYSSYVAFATSSPFTLTGGDGTKTVYMRLRDAAGNVSTFQDDIILDTDPPETNLISGPPAITNSSSATFNMNSDEVGSFEISLDGGAYATVPNPVTFTSLTPGSHTASIRAVDQAGNPDGSPLPYNWTIDQTAPTVNSVTVPANGTYGTGQQLNFTVVFNENITVDATGGTPYIPVTIGGTIVNATYISGSGTPNLLFRYTVQAGDLDADGIALG